MKREVIRNGKNGITKSGNFDFYKQIRHWILVIKFFRKRKFLFRGRYSKEILDL